MLKSKTCIVLILMQVLWFTTVTLAQNIEHLLEEPENLTQLILAAEAKRRSSPEEFSDDLKYLKLQVQQMSPYQFCHYQFLVNYEISFKGDHPQAIANLEKLVTQCEDLRALIRINAMLANIYVIGGKFEPALINIDAVISNAEQTNDKPSRVLAYSVAAIVYNLLKQTDLSQQYSQLLYQLDPTESHKCEADYYKARALLVAETGINGTDMDAVAQQCLQSNNPLFAYFLLLNYHRFQLKTADSTGGDLVKVRLDLLEIKAAVDQHIYKNLHALFYALLAETESKLENSSQAIEFAEKSLAMNESIGDSDQYIIALNVLENEALKVQQYDKSYEFLHLKSEAEKRIFNQNKAKEMAFMTVKHANLAKVFEIEQLNKQNSILALEKQLAKQEANNQKLVILLILTILVFLTLLLLRMKKRYNYFKGVSEIDHLTKVLTRKAFEDQMEVLMHKARNKNHPIHVAIMDLDHFKQVNDSHGHLIGDWVLKNVIYACKEKMEDTMLIARLGGEEFCIVKLGSALSDMFEKVEDMRVAIETLDCSESGADFKVTASFGIASSTHSGHSLHMLLTHADLALFEAKKRGRNQVIRFDQLKSD